MRRACSRCSTALALLSAASPALAADPPPTLQPGVLTVGVNMPSPGFQVGSVHGHGVAFARGLEVDLANALAARLGIPRVVFYQESQFARLIAPGPKPWDIALGEVTITPERAANVDVQRPVPRGRPGRAAPPRAQGDAQDDRAARALRLCSQSSTTSATLVATRVKPVDPAKLYGNTTLMLERPPGRPPLRRRRLRRPDPRHAALRGALPLRRYSQARVAAATKRAERFDDRWSPWIDRWDSLVGGVPYHRPD